MLTCGIQIPLSIRSLSLFSLSPLMIFKRISEINIKEWQRQAKFMTKGLLIMNMTQKPTLILFLLLIVVKCLVHTSRNRNINKNSSNFVCIAHTANL